MTPPDWDAYFMAIAFVAAQRSPDPRTKHGSVIVGQNNKILSMGYNGHPSGGNNSCYDWTSDDKYLHAIHSEANAILACEHRPVGAKIYITGLPCSNCTLLIIQSGIKEVISGPVISKMDIRWDLSWPMLQNHQVLHRYYTARQARLPGNATDVLQLALDKLSACKD